MLRLPNRSNPEAVLFLSFIGPLALQLLKTKQKEKGNLYDRHCESVDLCAAHYENGFYS